MKLYVYENLLSERFIEREISSCENRKKLGSYEQIFGELNLEGYFLVVENDEVKQYPDCAKDVPMVNAIIPR
jgi:hypothetical protein